MPRMFAKSVECQYPSIRSLVKLLPVGVISLVGMVLLSAGSLACGQEETKKTEKQPANGFSGQVLTADAQRDAAIKSDETQVRDLKQRAEELREKQRELRQAVQKTCGLSPENVSPILLGLERDRFNLQIEVRLKSARREELAQIIAKQTKQAEERVGDDEIVKQSNRVIAARQSLLTLQRARLAAQGVTEVDVKNAEANLAEAEIRLAVRRQEIAKSQADAVIDRLNQQLLDVSVELTQDELRLKLITTKLDALGAVQNLLDDYKYTTESELPRVLRLLDQAETRLAGLKYPN
jgi:hypothetical protein